MGERDFLIWLKGFRDAVGDGETPSLDQWKSFNLKLDEVITKVIRDKLLEQDYREKMDAALAQAQAAKSAGTWYPASYGMISSSPTYGSASGTYTTGGVVTLK